MSIRRLRGFTLIELLIVVAIIAILAAIAVPNFLEAQTRAKVSRSKADMRSLATAIEAYAIDWNMYPIAAQYVSGPAMLNNFNARLLQITTPQAYITTLPVDVFAPENGSSTIPFTPGQKPTFEYEDLHTAVAGENFSPIPSYNLFTNRQAYFEYFAQGRPITWHLLSAGPDRRNDFQQTPVPISSPAITIGINSLYDATNGTVSRGDITRTSAEQR